MDGVDDLARIDPLQIRAGGTEVGVPQLTLDDVDRHPLAGELDSVSMPELVVVPTSAQAPLGRHDRYAEPGEKVPACCDVGGVDVGITRAVVVILS